MTRYPTLMIGLHWLMAVMFIGMLIGGLAWGQDLIPSAYKGAFMGWHKAIGVSLLLLITLRIGARLWAEITRRIPVLPKTMKPTEAKLAKLGHLGLYGLMVAMPLSGWLMVSSSAKGWPTVLWGTGENAIVWPHMPFAASLKPLINEIMGEVHEYAAYFLLALVLLHIGATLKHKYKDGINLLPRMGVK